MWNITLPNIKPKAPGIFCLVLLLSFLSQNSAFADCAACAKLKSDLDAKTKAAVSMQGVKGKNEVYLITHPDASSSIQIKVKSNIMIASVRIETFQNEISLITSEITKGCAQCP